MPIRRVTPAEAADLLAGGWIYVDVRTLEEFDAGHPQGAFSVPLLFQSPGGRTSNPDFVRVVEGALGREARMVVGCAGGTRSRRAAELLAEAGFAEVVDMRGGFAGETDATGRLITPGWKASGLPTATAAEPGRGYQDLVDKARGGNS